MDNQLLGFTRLAATVARRVAPAPGRFAQPAPAPPAMLAALLLRERLRLTYRGLEDLLRLSGPLRRALGLRDVPDHSTLWWFARRHASPALRDAALAETVHHARGAAERAPQVALDSTGLFLSHTSWYFAWRAKRDRGQRSRASLSTAQVGGRSPGGSGRSSCWRNACGPGRAGTSPTCRPSRRRPRG